MEESGEWRVVSGEIRQEKSSHHRGHREHRGREENTGRSGRGSGGGVRLDGQVWWLVSREITTHASIYSDIC